MLHSFVTLELCAVLRLDTYPPVIFPARLGVLMLELDGEARLVESIDEGLNAGRIVVPSASIHVRAVLKSECDLGIFASMERIVDVSS
jgi:hypothetical protein